MSNGKTRLPDFITPPARICYVHLKTPKGYGPTNEGPKRSVTMLFSKTEPTHLAFLKGTIIPQLTQAWGGSPLTPIYGADNSPIKDGDTARFTKGENMGQLLNSKNPEYIGHYIIRPTTTDIPAYWDRGEDNAAVEMISPEKIYSGCYARIGCNAYKWAGGDGVSLGLNDVQFWADGEAIGGGKKTADQFNQLAGYETPVGQLPGQGAADQLGQTSNEFFEGSHSPGPLGAGATNQPPTQVNQGGGAMDFANANTGKVDPLA